MFLDRYYKPNKKSAYYFRIFRISDKSKFWLGPDYPFSGSQSTRTRKFGGAFIHHMNTDVWGWHSDYVQTLKLHLYRGKPIPAFHLAVWLYREREWPHKTTAEDIVRTVLREFKITKAEKKELFDVSFPSTLDPNSLFQDEEVAWEELRKSMGLPSAPDVPPDEGGTLSLLELRGVGPATELRFEPSERVNLITGDNGLGKTFLLECAWWALSGKWAGSIAYPRPDAKKNEPKIVFQISGETGGPKENTSHYNWEAQNWPSPRGRPTIPGLLIYARVDGAFAVWDPAKEYLTSTSITETESTGYLVFAREDVWDGLRVEGAGKTRFFSNGLINDWINWQSNPQMYPFETLKKVLRRLSPPDVSHGDLGPLEPGKPARIPWDSRLIPTIKHPYGEVPIVYASAGVRRIVSLAYLIVWAWEEHTTQSELIREDPQRRMVILVDEIEAHLHPQWQRVILPALLDVQKDLQADLQVQLLIGTHSPLVMASMEPYFETEKDKIFHLDLLREGLLYEEVRLDELDFVRHGTVDSWLMSEVFGMRHARSIEAERAIQEAKKLQTKDKVTVDEVQRMTDRLIKCLAGDDKFWPRWTYFAEKHGVEL